MQNIQSLSKKILDDYVPLTDTVVIYPDLHDDRQPLKVDSYVRHYEYYRRGRFIEKSVIENSSLN